MTFARHDIRMTKHDIRHITISHTRLYVFLYPCMEGIGYLLLTFINIQLLTETSLCMEIGNKMKAQVNAGGGRTTGHAPKTPEMG